MAHLIDKDALVAEIDRLFDSHSSKHDIDEAGVVLLQLRENVETLEVKEVDLEKELSTYLEVVKATDEDIDFVDFAKHFFELGLNASNPLTWKDIAEILDVTDTIANDDSMEECLKTMSEEEYCQEVLKRFKAQKGE